MVAVLHVFSWLPAPAGMFFEGAALFFGSPCTLPCSCTLVCTLVPVRLTADGEAAGHARLFRGLRSYLGLIQFQGVHDWHNVRGCSLLHGTFQKSGGQR